MDLVRTGQVVVLVLTPTLVVGAALYLPHIEALWRRIRRRRSDVAAQPTNPPIEQVAADLRRLLRQHDTVRRSTDLAMRARRLWAIDAAITDCAVQAARALDVPCPDRPAHGPLATAQLRQLLRELVDAGLVLPTGAGLLAPDPRP
jgi:hypothetical protein